MPRQATGPKYYPSKVGYYVIFQGTQYRLAKGPLCDKCAAREKEGNQPSCGPCKKIRAAADLRFAEIVHLARADDAQDDALVFALCSRYLERVKEKRKPKTYETAARFLVPFAAEYGHLKVRALKGVHVEDWLAKMARPRKVKVKLKGGGEEERVCKWGPSTQSMAHQAVQSAFNWCAKKGLITKNPVAGAVECPAARSRTKESLISPEQHAAVIARLLEWPVPRFKKDKGYVTNWSNRRIVLAYGKADSPSLLERARARLREIQAGGQCVDPFVTLVRLLHHTGARPGELYHAEARHWRADVGAVVYPRCDEPEKEEGFTHKTARKKKERTVFVAEPGLRAEVDALCARYPEGPILRNYFGEPWTANAVLGRWRKLRKALGLPKTVTPYSYRHASITDMILAGHPTALVAEVHGTSADMITRFYGHLDGHKEAMAAFWARAKGAAPIPPPAAD